MVQSKISIDSLPGRILARQKQYENRPERVQHDNLVRELIQYCRPDLQMYLGKEGEEEQGAKRGTSMCSSKVATDLERAADAFVGNLLHKGDWFRYRVKIPALNDDNQVQWWLQEREEQFNEIFTRANFYDEAPSAVMNALSLGNHASYAEYVPKMRQNVISSAHILSCWWSVDKFKNITGFHQKHLYDALEAYRLWGDKCSESLCRTVKEGWDCLDQYEFLQVVYATDDPAIGNYRLKYKSRSFVEFWVQVESEKNIDDRGILSEEPFNAMPFVLWPYRRSGDETMGRGALHVPSIKRLNNHYKTMMLTAQRAAQQPLVASATLENRIKLGPDGITYLDNDGETIHPLYGSGQLGYPFGIEYLERMEHELEVVLNLPMFVQFSQNTKEMTAYEVWQRMGEMAVVLGPRLHPMERNYLKPLHERFWQIEEDAGRIPDPPDILRVAAQHPLYKHLEGDLVDVEFMGPMAQVQQLFLEMRRMTGLWGSIQPFLAADPRAIRKINLTKSIERILDAGGWPQECIVSDEEIAAQDEMEAQMQQSTVAVANAEKEAKAIKHMSKPVEEGSPMSLMMGRG